MNNKKKNEGQANFSYYGLHLLDYLHTNKFEQADDTAFIRERADRAAVTYEKARLEGYPADGAQELAMDTLLRGLRYSRSVSYTHLDVYKRQEYNRILVIGINITDLTL